MANIRVDLNHVPVDGETVSFKAPCNASNITGLVIYYADNSGAAASREFTLTDANGGDIGQLDNVFAEGAIVKVILDTDAYNAFVQNPDTNTYLEGRFDGKADLQNGKVPASQLPAMDYAASDHKHAAGDVTSGTFDAARIPTLAASKVTSGTFAATGVKAASGTDYSTARIRNIKAQTTDLTAGTTSLTNGEICLVYE